MAETRWELKDNSNGRIYFPLTYARIRRWIREGRVKREDEIWRSGFSGWKKIDKTKEFKPYFEEEKPPEKLEEGQND